MVEANNKKAPVVKVGEVQKTRMEDGNVVHVPLAQMTAAASERVQAITGDPVRCRGCDAVLSAVSKLEPLAARAVASSGAHEHLWRCEFCDTANEISLDSGERPTAAITEYLLAPPPQSVAPEAEPMTVFCIDCSGSMCVSQEVQGKVALHALGQRRAQQNASGNASLAAFGDGSQQWLPSQRRRNEITYLSRLECVQAAVHAQLDALPLNRRVALVTFNGDVTAYLSGLAEPVVLAGDLLSDLDALVERGAQTASLDARGSGPQADKQLQQAREKLLDRVYGLQEGGATALGPALAFAMGLVLRRTAGSHIIVCTDGRANVGVGRLDFDAKTSAAQLEQERSVYARLGAQGRQHGTRVDVVSIRGDDCALEQLGVLADATAGSVDIFDPLELASRVARLDRALVATGVELSVHVPRPLRFRTTGAQQHVLKQQIGNVTSDSDFTASFESAAAAAAAAAGPIAVQTQVAYTRTDGTRLLRVVTETRAPTDKREQADFGIVGCNGAPVVAMHSIHRAASLAHAGDYPSARVLLTATQRAFQRAMHEALVHMPQAADANSARTHLKQCQLAYINFIKQAERLDGFMREATAQAKLLGSLPAGAAPPAAAGRVAERDDSAAKNIVQMKYAPRRLFEQVVV